MRVLHVTSHLHVGGITSYCISLAEALRRRGHESIIASGGGARTEELALLGIGHINVPLNTSAEFSPQVLWATLKLAGHLQRNPVDLVHGHTRVGQIVGYSLSRRFRIPLVSTWHGFYRPNLGRQFFPATGDATIAISQPVMEHLLSDFKVPVKQVHLIPHGIDVSSFDAPIPPEATEYLRNQLSLFVDVPVIGTVSRLVAAKGIDQLIGAFAIIQEVIPSARMLIVGDGEDHGHLVRLAQAHGLERSIHFTGALLDVRVALSLMQVFAFLPSDKEGFGLSLLEAMAARRPIVAVKRGEGAVWVMQETPVCLLVEPGNPKALADAILSLIEQPKIAQALSQEARRVVEQRYSLMRMVDAVEALYKNLVARDSSLAAPLSARAPSDERRATSDKSLNR